MPARGLVKIIESAVPIARQNSAAIERRALSRLEFGDRDPIDVIEEALSSRQAYGLSDEEADALANHLSQLYAQRGMNIEPRALREKGNRRFYREESSRRFGKDVSDARSLANDMDREAILGAKILGGTMAGASAVGAGLYGYKKLHGRKQ